MLALKRRSWETYKTLEGAKVPGEKPRLPRLYGGGIVYAEGRAFVLARSAFTFLPVDAVCRPMDGKGALSCFFPRSSIF